MRWLFLVMAFFARTAQAHDADVIFVDARPMPKEGRWKEVVTLSVETLALLIPLDADGDQTLSQADLVAKEKALRVGFWDQAPLTSAGKVCSLDKSNARLEQGVIQLEGEFTCAQGIPRQDFRFLQILPPNYKVVVGSSSGGRTPAVAQGALSTLSLIAAPGPDAGVLTSLRAGLFRSVALEGVAALMGLLFALATLRQRLTAVLLAVGTAFIGSWWSLGWWPPTLFLVLLGVQVGAKTSFPPIVAPLFGAAIGLRSEGGSALGTSLALLLVSPLAFAGAWWLRRQSTIRVTQWVPLGLILLGVALHASLT